jgi:hypothetical protein
LPASAQATLYRLRDLLLTLLFNSPLFQKLVCNLSWEAYDYNEGMPASTYSGMFINVSLEQRTNAAAQGSEKPI